MNPDISSLAAISAGYRREAARLEELRIKDIRESDAVRAMRSFDVAFRFAIAHSADRPSVGLTRAQRVLFGITG